MKKSKRDLLKKIVIGLHTGFPEAFKEEVKTKLEVGKWYKQINGNQTILSCFQGFDKKQYGFNASGRWSNDIGNAWYSGSPCVVEPATNEEVETALTREAKKRGIVEGATVNQKPAYNGLGDKLTIEKERGIYASYGNFSIGGIGVFSNGKWAEVVQTPELKEGQWYIKDRFLMVLNSKGIFYTRGFFDGEYGDSWIFSKNTAKLCRLATREEVGDALIKEAIRRKIWKTPIVDVKTGVDKVYERIIPYYSFRADILYSSYGRVYHKGKWATAITPVIEVTEEEVSKLLGYNVKFKPR